VRMRWLKIVLIRPVSGSANTSRSIVRSHCFNVYLEERLVTVFCIFKQWIVENTKLSPYYRQR
jgi:hypothetical protein